MREPIGINDRYSAPLDGTLNAAAPGVLANDVDADGHPLTATLLSGVSHGALTLNPDGSFSYTPDSGYRGMDSFTYKAGNGAAESAPTTVQLTPSAVNNPPVANNDSYSTMQNTALNQAASGVLTNDSDLDGNPLTAVNATNPTYGTVALNSDGSFTYTPNTGFYGTDHFMYQANDGMANSNVATVTITVTHTAGSGGSSGSYGGGAFDAGLVLVLGLAALARQVSSRAQHVSSRAQRGIS